MTLALRRVLRKLFCDLCGEYAHRAHNAPQNFDYGGATEYSKRVSRRFAVFLGNGCSRVRPDREPFRQPGLARCQLETRVLTKCRSDRNHDNRRGTGIMVLSVRRNNDDISQALIWGFSRQFDDSNFALTRLWKRRNYSGCHRSTGGPWRGLGDALVFLGLD